MRGPRTLTGSRRNTIERGVEIVGEARDSSDERGVTRWQERLLPFLVVAISLMAVFFFFSSLLQLQRLGEVVTYHPSGQVETFLDSYERQPRNADETRGL